MNHKNQTNDYTDFFYYTFRNILIVGIPLVIISAIILSSLHSSATNSGSGTDNLTITISSACTLSSVIDSEHSTNTNVGTYTSDIGKTTITTLCNDGNGYSVYAVGHSNNEEGDNKLINSEYPQYSIDTGLNTSGLTSAWAMKLNNIPDDPSPTPPTIESDYNNIYGIIPLSWTKVAGRQSGTTDMAEGSSFTTTYAVYASSSQYAGTYVGQVKYALLHPYKDENMLTIEDAFALFGKNKINIAGVGEYYAMQDMSSDICNTARITNEISQTQLVDIRDNKLYWVAKLDDGHCWMTQNLDLDLDPAKPLTSNDTDLTDHSLTGAYADDYSYDANTGITTWTPATSAKTIDFQNNGSVTGWQYSTTVPYSASKTNSTETGHASLGNYYNWTAAIASNNSSSLTQDTLSNISNNPKNSICPKGWRLPTISSQSETLSGSTNEFTRLNYLYNNSSTSSATNLMNNPVYFTLSGNISKTASGFTDLDNKGYYYSSTNYNSTNSYLIEIRQDFVSPSAGATYTNGREAGRSVRCIAR